MKIRLGVNVDHVATLRNARGEIHPDPYHSAKECIIRFCRHNSYENCNSCHGPKKNINYSPSFPVKVHKYCHYKSCFG